MQNANSCPIYIGDRGSGTRDWGRRSRKEYLHFLSIFVQKITGLNMETITIFREDSY